MSGIAAADDGGFTPVTHVSHPFEELPRVEAKDKIKAKQQWMDERKFGMKYSSNPTASSKINVNLNLVTDRDHTT